MPTHPKSLGSSTVETMRLEERIFGQVYQHCIQETQQDYGYKGGCVKQESVGFELPRFVLEPDSISYYKDNVGIFLNMRSSSFISKISTSEYCVKNQ